MRRIAADGAAELLFLKTLHERESDVDSNVVATVAAIIEDVKLRGDAAVRDYGLAFDGIAPSSFEVPKEEWERAYHAADPKFIKALENAAENIREYHERQIEDGFTLERGKGSWLSQRISGLQKVGIYVPGGTAAYPSTVLMNAIPAKIAGVGELVMTTPPCHGKELGNRAGTANPDILVAACIAGVDRIFLAGGAQSIAALAYGTDSFPKVDKIVGPGNQYVATAKRLLYGKVDIDMIAGPSEILVIADETANPAFIASDLLSQAEHDPMAAAVLLTTSEEIATKTIDEINIQKALLDRIDVIESSLADYGAIILCKNREEMIRICDLVAPEHLEIMTREPERLYDSVKNAGSVFLGDFSPEPLGDYYAGTNHVLPTSGTARFSSPLGVYSFIKRTSCTFYTKPALYASRDDILEISRREGLTAHGNSIKIRFSERRMENEL
jgi:histidinol dehydrogenase